MKKLIFTITMAFVCLVAPQVEAARIKRIINNSSLPFNYENTVWWQRSSGAIPAKTTMPTDFYIGWEEADGKRIDEKFKFWIGQGENYIEGFVQEYSFIDMKDSEKALAAAAWTAAGAGIGTLVPGIGTVIGAAALGGLSNLLFEARRARWVRLRQPGRNDQHILVDIGRIWTKDNLGLVVEDVLDENGKPTGRAWVRIEYVG